MWPFKKKDDAEIFFTTDEWAVRKFAPIELAKNFMPKAFKDMETFLHVKNICLTALKRLNHVRVFLTIAVLGTL